MTEERFRAILESYGADPARWPADERSAARAMAAAHPGLLADAAALDAVLALDVRAALDDADLRTRILAAAGANVVTMRPRHGFARAAAALAACAVAGVVTGYLGAPSPEDAMTEADAAFGAAFGITVGDAGDGG